MSRRYATALALLLVWLPAAVFAQTSSAFSQQGPKLVGTGGVGITDQGYAMALSADGNTLAVGGYSDNSYVGATWIFTRTGPSWSQQGPKLVGSGASNSPEQGVSIALSADGNTLAVGGYNSDRTGATWVFTRNGTTWSQQGPKLVGTGAVYAASLSTPSYAVALSADGNTLAMGGRDDNDGTGATWIFTRSGPNWSQQGLKLVGTGAQPIRVHQGSAVALSADGNTLAVGGSDDFSPGAPWAYTGSTWIFTRNGTSWSQQGAKLVGTGAVGPSGTTQGGAVALSADGTTLAVGGRNDNSGLGATWVFTRSGPNWSQQGLKLVGTGG